MNKRTKTIMWLIIFITLFLAPFFYVMSFETFTDADRVGFIVDDNSATISYQWEDVMTASVPLTGANYCTTCQAVCK